MYHTTKVVGFLPRNGVSAHHSTSRGRATRQQFTDRGLFCARPGTPGGGCLAEVRGYGSPLSKTEVLAHTTSIIGDLERGRFTSDSRSLGGTAASVPILGTSPGRSVRGRITPARTDGRFWPLSTTMREAPMKDKHSETRPCSGVSITEYSVGFLPRLKSWVSTLRFL